MEFVEYPDRDMMMIDLANILVTELTAALKHEDRVSFAVPGGTTPGPLFDSLCAADFDWSRIDVILTDERWVPETSERSNTRLLRERLLVDRAAKARLIPLYAEAPTPEEKLPDLSIAVGPLLPINVLLLGMGADMHTASLFPGAEGLEKAFETHAPLLMTMRPKGATEARVTLTAPVLAGAMAKHIIILGVEKRKAIEKASKLDDPLESPISAVLPGSTVHWAE
ncbi:6-phosphogluconolactonase [Pseudohalocynthiibacter aestuariivivens]|jgi:6-phosphogluconolactonase|uniref:6-phosphogluconolactonase n=1 Tax=Pseudohalocynthiibacter aestuariivivens TaxID=1591409 RepID=A0ABV5JG40_9RHOB|nr:MULTISPECIES: 6-phosphogluconolactonase [Pseudohalocynthiibacter]MBS9716230.1 6-phosphogluconolactonase [Pseudohalocynthiibacter aestuariivivens]MCK0100963.1 6-phosphogluconolactonase [Pseudohalocynthiibacter sp. F2068]